jgi:hypothetical protein
MEPWKAVEWPCSKVVHDNGENGQRQEAPRCSWIGAGYSPSLFPLPHLLSIACTGELVLSWCAGSLAYSTRGPERRRRQEDAQEAQNSRNSSTGILTNVESAPQGVSQITCSGFFLALALPAAGV